MTLNSLSFQNTKLICQFALSYNDFRLLFSEEKKRKEKTLSHIFTWSLVSIALKYHKYLLSRSTWNHILIWRSVRQRACAISMRRLLKHDCHYDDHDDYDDENDHTDNDNNDGEDKNCPRDKYTFAFDSGCI